MDAKHTRSQVKSRTLDKPSSSTKITGNKSRVPSLETKRLIPYSVHLREDIYLRLKQAAGQRKATSMVRDAITMIIEGDDAFNSGYKKALRDVADMLRQDHWCKIIGVNGESFSHRLASYVEGMGDKHGKK